jgi:hypothetical protein
MLIPGDLGVWLQVMWSVWVGMEEPSMDEFV